MRIRAYEPDDAGRLGAVFVAAIRQTGRFAYSEEQVRVWAAAVPDPGEYHEYATDGRVVLVAVDEQNRPIAYGDVEADGHIDHLFCHPDAGRKGVASALYDRLEETARRLKISRLYVEASELARPVFRRKGFIEIGRRDFEFDGVWTYNYAMEKVLG